MFFTFQLIGVFLCISQLAFGLPAGLPELAPERPTRAVVRVVARASATCSSCATPVTVIVSGTLATTAAPNAVTVRVGAPTSTASSSAIGNFGSCTTPQIEFGAGFDGRTETAFQPVDKTSFDHESADNIAVIAAFICSSLATSCNADATAQATCSNAQAAAAAAPSQQGIDADTFNAFFGIQTNFKDVTPISSASVPIAASTNYIGSSTVTSDAANATTSPSSTSKHDPQGIPTSDGTISPPATASAIATPTQDPPSLSPTAAPAAASLGAGDISDNLQVFTGDLGGIQAPTVVASDGRFQVEGNSIFRTKAEALARSCDIQKNDCADAANKSGNKGDFTVEACSTQQAQCIAAT